MSKQVINFNPAPPIRDESVLNGTFSTYCSEPLQCFLKKLVHLQEQLPLAQLESLVMSSGVSLLDFERWCCTSEDAYSRVTVYENEAVEVAVLTWKPGQISPIHDHKESSCVASVLKGVATEIVYQRSATDLLFPSHTTRQRTGEVIASSGEDVHQMGNLSDESDFLITLHCYSPPLRNMRSYRSDQTIFAETPMFFS